MCGRRIMNDQLWEQLPDEICSAASQAAVRSLNKEKTGSKRRGRNSANTLAPGNCRLKNRHSHGGSLQTSNAIHGRWIMPRMLSPERTTAKHGELDDVEWVGLGISVASLFENSLAEMESFTTSQSLMVPSSETEAIWESEPWGLHAKPRMRRLCPRKTRGGSSDAILHT